MSVRIYTSPGYVPLHTPTVLRQHVPGRVSRHVRYARSLSTPLVIDKQLSYPLLETNRREYVNSFLGNKRREVSNFASENRRGDFGSISFESWRRELSNALLENKTPGLASSALNTKRRDVSNNFYTGNKHRDLRSIPEGPRRSAVAEARPTIRWWNKDNKLSCTPEDLLEIIREPTGQYELPTDPCNEVYPGIYLSDGPTALCTSLLKKMGVSHVLNAAQGKERPGQVNTSPSFYSYSQIRYLGVEAFDHIAFKLHPYFNEASDFMQEALDSGGKVLVHCRAGISRSATLVCAFLMLKRHLSAKEAVRTVRKNRPIIPNDGFLQQLCDLNERLQKKGREL